MDVGIEVGNLWRGSLLPLGCAAVAKSGNAVPQDKWGAGFGAASRPGGSKLPRHKGNYSADGCVGPGLVKHSFVEYVLQKVASFTAATHSFPHSNADRENSPH
ncbi:hypothetical protein FCH79_20215 [Pseudomonas koreensis]|nr:hypothetical protein [Pseudomonas koreensis]